MANCGVGTKAGYLLAGLSMGAAVALLFAPRSGKTTRRLIADRVEEGRDYVGLKGRGLRRQADDFVDRGKALVSQQKDKLADVLEAGKEAARETFTR
jgi:gas vesicle protein